MRDKTCVKSRLLSLYLYFAANIRTLLRTRDTIFPSILPVSAKVAIFRNIVPLSMYYHSKNEHEIHTSGTSARDIPIWVYLCIVMTSNLPFVHSFMQFQLKCVRDVIFCPWWIEFFCVICVIKFLVSYFAPKNGLLTQMTFFTFNQKDDFK